MNPAKSNPSTFQELILRLQTFWAERGCVLQQPYDVEVGAGTMAPETFLRVLGPQPYKVAYVQPSRRPADGRYGENPNRLFKHMQLQVILKPPPENVQELYLESLAAIGVDLRQHDIKFEAADVEKAWKHFELCEAECKGLIEKYAALARDKAVGDGVAREKARFPLLAAYDLCLKCSHLFNILDARGAISVTERVGVIARVRSLAVGITKAYLDQQGGGKSVAQHDMIKAVPKPPRAAKSKKVTVTS